VSAPKKRSFGSGADNHETALLPHSQYPAFLSEPLEFGFYFGFLYSDSGF